MENRFYVYEHIRLDTMKPFYVGKGCGKRAYTKARRNTYWKNIVSKHGYFVCFVAENIDEDLAFLIEVERIDQLRHIGVELANLTDGGEGPSGLSHTEDAKSRISAANRGLKRSVEAKKNLSIAKRNSWKNTEYRKKMSEVNIGRARSVETKSKISSSMINMFSTPEAKKKASDVARKRCQNAETLKKMSDAAHKQWSSEEARNKQRETMLEQPKILCPHCGKIGSIAAMHRWHFDNCKLKEK